jgi:hypothetical protein
MNDGQTQGRPGYGLHPFDEKNRETPPRQTSGRTQKRAQGRSEGGGEAEDDKIVVG